MILRVAARLSRTARKPIDTRKRNAAAPKKATVAALTKKAYPEKAAERPDRTDVMVKKMRIDTP